MPADQEQNGTEAEGIPDVGVRGVPGSSKIEQQGGTVERIGQQTVQNSRTYDAVILVDSHDINHEGYDIGTTSQSNTGYHVETHPQAPGGVL